MRKSRSDDEQLGFDQVYQLDGGILNYFEKCGNAHYDGDCFVFDQRVAVTPQLQPSGAQYCFACQAVLKGSDLSSNLYRRGEYCPHCYKTPDEMQRRAVEKRQSKLDALVKVLPGSMAYESRRPMYVARQYAGLAILDWLVQMHRGLDREYWMRELNAQRIVIGPILETASEVVTESRVTKEGERYIHVQPDYVEPDVDASIKILYEDASMLVVNKPAPLPSHASGKFFKNTLEHILGHIYAPEKLHLAHRLDANTTGILLLSRRHMLLKSFKSSSQQVMCTKLILHEYEGILNAMPSSATLQSVAKRPSPVEGTSMHRPEAKSSRRLPNSKFFAVMTMGPPC